MSQKPDYDTTLARIAGNIASGLVSCPGATTEGIAREALAIAREIVKQLRTPPEEKLSLEAPPEAAVITDADGRVHRPRPSETTLMWLRLYTGWLSADFPELNKTTIRGGIMSETFKHDLGDAVKCRLTGLEGIITSRAEHLYGCARYWVQPREVKDGKAVEGAWYDEDQIEVTTPQVIQRVEYRRVAHSNRLAGGPTMQPPSTTRQTTK